MEASEAPVRETKTNCRRNYKRRYRMYISFYDLAELPFRNTADRRFLWLGEKHKEALAALQYGIMEEKGFVLLTGDVGTGKTTLINALLGEIGDEILVASLSDPGLDKIGFLKLVSRAFQIPGQWERLDEFFVFFENFLRNAHHEKKQVLLIVDEAQKLSEEVLEQVRVLSNIELPETKLINIVLVGQDELYENLQKHGCRALRQRINLHHRLNTLSENETIQYVRHRLKVAGLEKKLFDRKALRLVHRFSKGYPRLVNRICDHALLTGFVREAPVITPQIVKECSREILFPSETARVRKIPELLRKAKRLFLSGKRISRTVSVAVFLALLGGVAALLSRAEFFERWEKGRISRGVTDMAAAISARESSPEPQKTTLPAAADTGAGTTLTAVIEEPAKTIPALQLKSETPPVSEPSAMNGVASEKPHGKAQQREHKSEKAEERKEESEAPSARNWVELGKSNTKAKNYGKAADAYEKAAKLVPNSPDVFFNLGYLRAQLKDYDGAEKMFLRATELAPSYLDQAFFNLAMVQLKQGKKQECLENLERTLEINPDNEKARKYAKQLNDFPGGSK